MHAVKQEEHVHEFNVEHESLQLNVQHGRELLEADTLGNESMEKTVEIPSKFMDE